LPHLWPAPSTMTIITTIIRRCPSFISDQCNGQGKLH
jgi:hypothetical protein